MIHLLNRRRISVVRWGAMHLLQEVIKQKKRRLHIEQWLLLLVRIALPIVLALCLARPVLTALRQLPGFGKTSLVVLLNWLQMPIHTSTSTRKIALRASLRIKLSIRHVHLKKLAISRQRVRMSSP